MDAWSICMNDKCNTFSEKKLCIDFTIKCILRKELMS